MSRSCGVIGRIARLAGPSLVLSAVVALGSGPAAFAAEPLPLKAAACHGCHVPGEDHTAIPAIEQLSPATIESEMRAFRAGERLGTIMPRLAKGYTDEEIAQIAAALGRADGAR